MLNDIVQTAGGERHWGFALDLAKKDMDLIDRAGNKVDPETVDSSLGVLLKYQDDIEKIRGSEAAQILDQVKAELALARR